MKLNFWLIHSYRKEGLRTEMDLIRRDEHYKVKKVIHNIRR